MLHLNRDEDLKNFAVTPSWSSEETVKNLFLSLAAVDPPSLLEMGNTQGATL